MLFTALCNTKSHEGLSIEKEPETKYSGSDLEDVKMDIHNNWVGYQIGIENSKASKEKIQKLVLEALKKGKLKVLYPNSNNSKSIEENLTKLRKDYKAK